MKIQTVEYKEVVVAYKDGNNHRLINSIWEQAPFKFKQYDDIRNGDLVHGCFGCDYANPRNP
jgi:hypothetical protein